MVQSEMSNLGDGFPCSFLITLQGEHFHEKDTAEKYIARWRSAHLSGDLDFHMLCYISACSVAGMFSNESEQSVLHPP